MLSRLERLRKLNRDEDFHPEMPEVDEMEHVLGYLYEIGPTMLHGMGEAPITNAELVAWQANTGIELSSWAARTLLRLSRDYLAQSHKSQKDDCPPPWEREDTNAAMKAAAAVSMRDHLRGLRSI